MWRSRLIPHGHNNGLVSYMALVVEGMCSSIDHGRYTPIKCAVKKPIKYISITLFIDLSPTWSMQLYYITTALLSNCSVEFVPSHSTHSHL